MRSCFFRELQLIAAFLLIRNFYTAWSTRFISLKLCVEFSIFSSVSFFYSLYFCSAKSIYYLNSKRHNSLQNKNNRKVTHTFVSRPLIFTLQQEVWKFSNICVSWTSPKTDLETNFLNLENPSFVHLTFSQ